MPRFPGMTFALLLATAIALPLALWWVLAHRTLHAVALAALACGLVATALGLWLVQGSSVFHTVQADGATLHDTLYVVMPGIFLRNMGLVYFPLAAGLALIAHLGPTILRRLTLPVFGAFHLGATITMLLNAAPPPLAMPRRYVDYPDWFHTINQITSLAAMLGFFALSALILLLLAALLHAFHRSSL